MKRAKKHLPPSKVRLLAALAWLREKEPKRHAEPDLSPPYCGMHLIYRPSPTPSASVSALALHTSETPAGVVSSSSESNIL